MKLLRNEAAQNRRSRLSRIEIKSKVLQKQVLWLSCFCWTLRNSHRQQKCFPLAFLKSRQKSQFCLRNSVTKVFLSKAKDVCSSLVLKPWMWSIWQEIRQIELNIKIMNKIRLACMCVTVNNLASMPSYVYICRVTAKETVNFSPTQDNSFQI